jgi:hypothetical protein
MVVNVTQRERSLQHGIRLEYLTVGWNILEGAVAILSGMIAGSVALVGFGIDSAIESSSAQFCSCVCMRNERAKMLRDLRIKP